MNKTLLINLYGGPGAGKSTSAARLFSFLKDEDRNVELVTEYVKEWAWQDRKPINYDQFYLFGKQTRKEYTLFNKVDVIISDSPVELTSYYASLYGTTEQKDLFKSMVAVYRKMCETSGVTVVNVFLARTKKYNPSGRFQNESEALSIDKEMRSFFKNLVFLEHEGSEEGILGLMYDLKWRLGVIK